MELEEPSRLKQCSIGSELNQECHKNSYSRKCGLLTVSDLSEKDKKLLQWRAELGLSVNVSDDICFHHEKMYISRYESLQRYCCDPFQSHKKHVSSK